MDVSRYADRSRVLGSVRAFFLDRGYLETDTPILAPALIPEPSIEVFRTDFGNPFLGECELYLVPSPEVWMKRIIAETGRSVFQVAKCFRNSESIGRVHSPEFAMLEYYTVGFASGDNIGLTEELFAACAGPDTPPGARPPFRRMTMAEAFGELAGLDLAALQDSGALVEAGRGKGLAMGEGASWEDAFNVVFLSLVEPRLPGDRPLVLDEFPRQIECLAKDVPGTPWKERWELYVGGVELANCYTEETGVEAAREYFERAAEKKRAASVPHRVDFEYPELIGALPPCSGVAVGFDRMTMALRGESSLEAVLPFPFEKVVAPYLGRG